MKILVLALSGIGDALMFTPSIKKLRAEFPDSEISVLTMIKGVADIYKTLPDIGNVLFFDFMKEGFHKSLHYIFELRKKKYDISINVYPSNRKEYNIINFLIGAKKRLSTTYLRCDFSNLGFLNNVRVQEDDMTHNVVTNFKLVQKLSNKINVDIPDLELILSDDNNHFADDFLLRHNIKNSDIIIGFHTGCNTLKNHINRR